MEWALSHVARFGSKPVLLVECGVATDASLAHMLAFSKAHDFQFRIVGFDSLEGVPDASTLDGAKLKPDSQEFKVYRAFSKDVVQKSSQMCLVSRIAACATWS